MQRTFYVGIYLFLWFIYRLRLLAIIFTSDSLDLCINK